MNAPICGLHSRITTALAAIFLVGSITGYAQVYERMVSFTEELASTPNKGSLVMSDLVGNGSGNLYGTTQRGGPLGNGTVFKVSPTGALTTLVEFTGSSGNNKGQAPNAGLVLGSDGDFYGTTQSGGTYSNGTVFKVTPDGVLTTLVDFNFNDATNRGVSPTAGVVEGSDGDFYGMTTFSPLGFGTIYSMTPAGVLTTLVELTGTTGINLGSNSQSGFNILPQARMVEAGDGNFYGMTPEGGATNNGTIFKMTPAGVLTTLVEFTGSSGSTLGDHPQAGLTLYTDGNFYGTTERGGAANLGTIFKMTPAGVLTTMVEFSGNSGATKGSNPNAALMLDTDGNFYGTTAYGGASGRGTIFRMAPAGLLTTIAEFSNNGTTDKGGIYPRSGVVRGGDGNLYGTTTGGGAFGVAALYGVVGFGTVYQVTPTGELSTLVDFRGRGDTGVAPDSGLLQGIDGNFYGTTVYGGPSELGTVYRMTPGGVLTTLAPYDQTLNAYPHAPLLNGDDGNFYGTTLGSIFKMAPDGEVTTLVGLGSNRYYAGLITGSDGNFYGTSSQGGTSNFGTVFKMTPSGMLTTLVEFTGTTGANKGSNSHADLVEGSDGNFYGTTLAGGASDFGTIFKMTPAGVLTTLVEFTGTAGSKGQWPYAGLVEGLDGAFYGTTSRGGAPNYGTVFKVTTAGALTTLVEFTSNGAILGSNPLSGLLLDADGDFYGTTQSGGTLGAGTVFKMTHAGALTTLIDFVEPEYGQPNYSELIRGADGNLYGTASESFSTSGGSIYRVVLPGPPIYGDVPATPTGSDSAFVQTKVNPRDASTTVTVEYWTGGETPPSPPGNSVSVAVNLTGSQSLLVGTTLQGLEEGTIYYYRFKSESAEGISYSEVRRIRTLVYEKMFSFAGASMGTPNRGSIPIAELVGDGLGNFYGTTRGTFDNGTIFKLSSTGVLTTLVEFTGTSGPNKGAKPMAGLVRGGDGNFYGTTYEGGAFGSGTAFKMTPTGVLTTLYDFNYSGTDKTGYPSAGLLSGSDGNFYGMTTISDPGFGTVFKITPAGVLTKLVEFTGTTGAFLGKNSQSGSNIYPQARLVEGSSGEFYGMTPEGGTSNHGTVFKVTSTGVLTTLLEFTGTTGSNKGSHPQAGLVKHSNGNFYGTTERGGAFDFGTVFKVTPAGVLTSLVEFTGSGGDDRGAYPNGSLTLDVDGGFYGTTYGGGPFGRGTVFRMTAAGVLTTIADFELGTIPDREGVHPRSGVVRGADGNFYGTTVGGGAYGVASLFGVPGFGTVYKVTPAGELTTLIDFAGRGDTGIGPYSGLLQDTDGNFYGTTQFGGPSELGTVFRMTAGGELTTLAPRNSSMGAYPYGRLAKGDDGNIYGTTLGTIFKMAADGVVTTLVGSGSNRYYAGLITGSDGNFYGTSNQGGTLNFGTVFRLITDGSPGGSTLETLVEFTDNGGSNKGKHPGAALVEGFDGNFYGTTTSGGASGFGTVFKVTPAGMLTTLVEFTGNGANDKGQWPEAKLVQGDDGAFYGTTSRGGTSNYGTVFKITPAGVLTNLVEFTSNGASNKGSVPLAGLLKDDDGSFYGTTQSGGVNGFGTVFRVTSSGVLTTLYEFTAEDDGSPNYGELIRGLDGNLYGATSEGFSTEGGSVYRLILPGPPMIANATPIPPGATTALIQARANARGPSTDVTLDYWTGTEEPPTTPSSVVIATALTGYQTQLVGTTLTGLTQGTVYYYRFRAESNAGMSESPVQSFSPVETVTTLAAPLAVSLPASNISPTSALLNGTVNARNFDSSVIIEWGTDGNSFPNKVSTTPATVTGNTAVPVSLALGGLDVGGTYFYRIVASNAGGTVTSGTQTYRTLVPATATITNAAALSTTRAQVTGIVDAKGSSADISFEYGTDGSSFPNSFSAAPATVAGELPEEVTAILTGLTQGTTYHFRIRAQGPGGTGFSETSTFSLSILSGLAQVFPDPPQASSGTVTVNFSPTNVGAWRFTGDTKWLNSGIPSGNLATGQRVIEFLPIPGFIRPPSETVDVTSSGNFSLDRVYFDTPVTGSGSLTVRLKPDEISAPEVPLANRTQWRIVGEAVWRDSDANVADLPAGSYLVECKSVAGRETPSTTSVSIGTDDSQEITLTYFTANTSVGSPPLPQSFSDVSTNEDLPFAHLGQIRTEVGSSTGFVVKRRVVATAGHVVFDDGTLSAITDMQWFFQRHSGEHEPRPQIPRGYYLAAGYAAQRIIDDSPGEGSAQSQTLDYAALYFVEEAGRGGYGGFLASDSGDDNEFLTSTSGKILAGYPVDGISTGDAGRLHATAPFTPALTPAFGETWTTTEVRGFGGISGGPLFVQFENGSYLPAAIYLGGAGQTVVRAIDSNVVELFLRAEVSGNGGDNNTGGGITHSSVSGNLNIVQAGSLRVLIEPAGANAIGAAWQLNPEATLRQGGTQKSGLSPGTYNLGFKTIPGFQAPVNQPVAVTGGQLTTITFTYQEVVSETPLEIWRQSNFGTTENTGDAADGEDPDKDGVTNIDEYVAGTDPNSSSDFLKAATASKSGSTFTVGCSGKAGRTYTLQRNTSLGGTWTPLTSQGPLPSDQAVSLSDTAAPADASYYRIEVSIP